MFLIGLGELLVLCGVLYMVRAVIWRGSLSGPDSGRPVRGTLEPRRRGVGILGLEANRPGILLMAIGAILLLSGIIFQVYPILTCGGNGRTSPSITSRRLMPRSMMR